MALTLEEKLEYSRLLSYKDATSLAGFVRQGWDVIEPGTDLIWNWHIDAICQHLEAVTDGRIRWLLINVPPGHMKSLIVSVFWPAWIWTKKPQWRGLFGSYAMDLAIRDSVRCRDLILSEWYQDTFRPKWRFKQDQNVKSHFENSVHGFRYSLSVGSQATGWRGDCIVVDDPLNVKDQWSEAARLEAIRWWDKTMATRLNDPRRGSKVIIMQRLHEEDLSGHMLERGDYEHLCLPSEYDPARRCRTLIGWEDPRREEGELLFPDMFTASVLEGLKGDLGTSDFAGQHQQLPAPDEGVIIKKTWLRYYDELPAKFDEKIQSWDCAFKDLKTSSFVAGGVFGRIGANCYLIDRIHAHLDMPGTLNGIRNMTARHPDAVGKLVEDKANGPAVVQTLKNEIPGMIEVTPEGGKIARANAIAPMCQAGNYWLPSPKIASWVEQYVHNLTTFPGAKTDDDMDMTSQALTYLGKSARTIAAWSGAGEEREA